MVIDETTRKVYIKYGLTEGIIIVEAEIYRNGKIYVPGQYGGSYYNEKEWSENLDDAIAAVEQMRLKRIESLKKKIAKLEKLKVKVGYE